MKQLGNCAPLNSSFVEACADPPAVAAPEQGRVSFMWSKSTVRRTARCQSPPNLYCTGSIILPSPYGDRLRAVRRKLPLDWLESVGCQDVTRLSPQRHPLVECSGLISFADLGTERPMEAGRPLRAHGVVNSLRLCPGRMRFGEEGEMNRRRLLRRRRQRPRSCRACPPGCSPRHGRWRHPPLCRVRPNDPAWPSDASWDRLGRKVGGRLVRVQSPLTTCLEAPSSLRCTQIFQGLRNYLGDEVGLHTVARLGRCMDFPGRARSRCGRGDDRYVDRAGAPARGLHRANYLAFIKPASIRL